MKTKPNELAVPTFPLSRFTFNKSSRVLCCEASDLGNGRMFSRLYNDAMDIGLAIRSEFSERVERFYLSHGDTDSEGETTAWIFKPVNSLTNVSEVIIYND